MAIQNRRGDYHKLNKQKLLPGEYAIVLQNDPNCADGKAAYLCFSAGDTKRLATYEDMVENICDATTDVQQQFTEEMREATDKANENADYAKSEGNYANAGGDYANTQGDYAKSEGSYANAQGNYAKAQGDRADNLLDDCLEQTRLCKSATDLSVRQTAECRDATEKALDAASGLSIVYDPSDGKRETIQETLNHIWTELIKATGSPLTAGEYDALGVTAGWYDAKNLNAGSYDASAGTILTA